MQASFLVEAAQEQWLTAMAATWQLPDVGKALRIILEFAVTSTDPREVFGVVRKHCTHGPGCTTCAAAAGKGKLTFVVSSSSKTAGAAATAAAAAVAVGVEQEVQVRRRRCTRLTCHSNSTARVRAKANPSPNPNPNAAQVTAAVLTVRPEGEAHGSGQSPTAAALNSFGAALGGVRIQAECVRSPLASCDSIMRS